MYFLMELAPRAARGELVPRAAFDELAQRAVVLEFAVPALAAGAAAALQGAYEVLGLAEPAGPELAAA